MENAYQQLQCEKKGHNFSPYTYICMSETCTKPDKLLCTKCAIEHGHSDSYVLFEEIIKKDSYSVENWPQDENGKKIKNILIWNSVSHARSQIDNMFDEFQDKLINKLQALKKELIQQFGFQAENMRADTQNTQQYFERAYSLKEFKQKIIEFLQEDIDKQDMEDIIVQYLRNPERKLAQDQAKKASLPLIPNCRYFIDKQSFQQVCEKEFYEKIHLIKSCFTGGYHPLNWKLQNSLLYQSNNIREINPGITYQSQCENGEEVLFSQDSFSKGVHGFRLRFDSISETYRCHVLLGLYDKIKQKDDFKPYLCLMCCDHKLCMVSKKNKDFNIHSGSVVDVKANFDNNLFEIKEVMPDGSEGAVFGSTIKTVDKNTTKRQKFFIFFSSSGHHQITLLSSY